MALLTETEVRAAARETLTKSFRTADQILLAEAATSTQHFDIFLSHSIKDAELILGVLRILEGRGKRVYVDWIYDHQLNREKVSPETARQLRNRMTQSEALFYVHTRNSTSSRWMPWELGFFDGHNGNVAILPVVRESQSSFQGEEYLGLYPYVDFTVTSIWIHRDTSNFKNFEKWKNDQDKLRPQ